MPRERFEFDNGRGQVLAGLLDRPQDTPSAYALFAHCFTCGKDIRAAARIAAALTERGIAVLRFDFTGLGASEGEFANTGFSSNVDDLVAAADSLRQRHAAPQILIGHSLGGAAVLAAAHRMAEVRAVATIAAPSDPSHVTHLFGDRLAEIASAGEVEVELGQRRFRIGRGFVEDVAEQRLKPLIGTLRRALLVLHGPLDGTVGIDNAATIFGAAKHPKSFVSLDKADHLLSGPGEAAYAAAVIAAWASRYVEQAQPEAEADATPGLVRVRETGHGRFQQEVRVGAHRLLADEPPSVGGSDTGPDPYGLLLASLGACTAMTLRMYADRKALPLTGIAVDLRHEKVHARDGADPEQAPRTIDRIDRVLHLQGDLGAAQRDRLREIADLCPVHKTLHGKIEVATVLAPADSAPAAPG